MRVVFTVIGLAAPQGSKTRTKFAMREDNPKTAPWRAAVAYEASRAMEGQELLLGPVMLSATFYFPRPKAHYRTGKRAAELRDNAPEHVAKKPDLDKLCRAIGDSIAGIVVRDDAQIAAIDAVKLYGSPAAHIGISTIGQKAPA